MTWHSRALLNKQLMRGGSRLLVLALGSLVSVPSGALDPSRTIGQYHHTGWTGEDGAPTYIWSLAQSADGFLWLGTSAGLFRFDGVKFEEINYRSRGTNDAPAYYSLAALPDGALIAGANDGSLTWIKGASIRQDKFCFHGGFPRQIVRGTDGHVWATVDIPGSEDGGVLQISLGSCRLLGSDSNLPHSNDARIAAGPSGTIWVTIGGGLYFKKSGSAKFTRTNVVVSRLSLIQTSADNVVYVSNDGVVNVYSGNALERSPSSRQYAYIKTLFGLRVKSMLVDKRGGLWMVPLSGGILRLSPLRKGGRTDKQVFTAAQGLTSDSARPLLEDSEGDLWIGGVAGLDRLRDAAAVPLADIPRNSPGVVAAPASDRSGLIVHVNDTTYRVGPDLKSTLLYRGPEHATALCVGNGQGLVSWLSRADDFIQIGRKTIRAIAGPIDWHRNSAAGCFVTDNGFLIAYLFDGRVFKLQSGSWRQIAHFFIPKGSLLGILKTVSGKGLWLDISGLGIFNIQNGRTRRIRTASSGSIKDIVGFHGGVIVVSNAGLEFIDRLRARRLRSSQIPNLGAVTGIAFDGSQVWLTNFQGVIKVSATDLAAAFDNPGYRPSVRRFGSRDGLPGGPRPDATFNNAFAALNRIWIVTGGGVAWIDPVKLGENSVPPKVIVESLAAGGRTVTFPTSVTLRSGARSIQVDYTATSLMSPESTRFRYRLTGVDKDWVDAETRRQAFYTKLPPGNYTFRVIAVNSSGVWNREGAVVRFTVPPFWYETKLFRASAALLLGLVVWLIYMVRIRAATSRMRGLVEERVAERERIARELHDTLLQGFQGLMLRFRAVTAGAPLHGSANALLDEALERAERVLVEGRDSVCDLRLTGPSSTLEAAIAAAANDIADGTGARFAMVVEGTPRPLHPMVASECRRIGEEALANAFRHAEAGTIEARITYGSRVLRMQIKDDGRGMTAKGVATVSDRHFGLTGMRERAESVKGELSIRSSVGTGTSVELVVPARIAYARIHQRRRATDIVEGGRA